MAIFFMYMEKNPFHTLEAINLKKAEINEIQKLLDETSSASELSDESSYLKAK